MLCSLLGALENVFLFFPARNVFNNFCNACVSRVRFIITKNKITKKKEKLTAIVENMYRAEEEEEEEQQQLYYYRVLNILKLFLYFTASSFSCVQCIFILL